MSYFSRLFGEMCAYIFFISVCLLSITFLQADGDKEYAYSLAVYTGDHEFAGTDAHILVKMNCSNGTIRGMRMKGNFDKNSVDIIKLSPYRGTVCELSLWREDNGVDSAWFIDKIVVNDNVTASTSVILYNKWIPAKQWVDILVPGTGGKWNEWSSWSVCPVPCEEGTSWRHRTCASPLSFDCHSQTCQGRDKERAACRGVCTTDVQTAAVLNSKTTALRTANTTPTIVPSETSPRYGKIYIIVGTGLLVFAIIIGVILGCQRRKHRKRQYNAGCRSVSVRVDNAVKLSNVGNHADDIDDESPPEYAIITGSLANCCENLAENDEGSSTANERMLYLMGIDKTEYLIINPQTGQRVMRLGSLGAYEHTSCKQATAQFYKGLAIPEYSEEGAETRRVPMFRSMSACASYHEKYDHICPELSKRSNSAGKQYHHYDHMVLDKVSKTSDTSAHSAVQESSGEHGHYDCLERPQVLAGNVVKDAGESHYDRLPGDDSEAEGNRDSIYF